MDEIVAIGFLDGRPNLVGHLAGNGIQPIRPIESDGGDAIVATVAERLIGQGFLLLDPINLAQAPPGKPLGSTHETRIHHR